MGNSPSSSAGLVLADSPSQPQLEDSFIRINNDLSKEDHKNQAQVPFSLEMLANLTQ